MDIDDLSCRTGDPIDGPSSHQNGLDVDIRLPRRDRSRDAAGPGDSDRTFTQAPINRPMRRAGLLIPIGPSPGARGSSGVVGRWPARNDHLHLRIPG